MVIDAISVDVIVRRVQIKKRGRDRMEPCRTALLKSKSGGTEIWKEGFQKGGGDQHLEMLEKSRRKQKSIGFGD